MTSPLTKITLALLLGAMMLSPGCDNAPKYTVTETFEKAFEFECSLYQTCSPEDFYNQFATYDDCITSWREANDTVEGDGKYTYEICTNGGSFRPQAVQAYVDCMTDLTCEEYYHAQHCQYESKAVCFTPPSLCTDEDECPHGHYCEIKTGNCLDKGDECFHADDCYYGQVCNHGFCLNAKEGLECPDYEESYICDRVKNQSLFCFDGELMLARDCSLYDEVCSNGFCK